MISKLDKAPLIQDLAAGKEMVCRFAYGPVDIGQDGCTDQSHCAARIYRHLNLHVVDGRPDLRYMFGTEFVDVRQKYRLVAL